MDMETSSCYGGGDIAATFFGTLICGIAVAYIAWWLYRKYWNTRKGTHLVQEDPETGKGGEFAFDNPAFKSDGSKAQSSPLDTKWLGIKPTNGTSSIINEKRKTQDDNAVSTSDPPRIIGLRGSDFTGLGIELCGGLKEGIFVRKVMPQGPAAGVVNVGDKISSITIDFNHLVLEDAVAILSYASPYNVKLELVDAKANVATMVSSNSPKSNTSTLSHPLYRSGSQSDVNTIERNSRKNLFPEEKDHSMQSKSLPVAHKENEVKSKTSSLTKQFKEMIEEKFQNRSSNSHESKTKDEVDHSKASTSPTEENKKGLKFGIRVLPDLFGKSPNKVQADNENNVNLEKSANEPTKEAVFQRRDSINSSGIKRDAAGIPQEMPEHMLQAALSAKDNRKSNNNAKGKAPKPPPVEIDKDTSTETMNTSLDINSPPPVDISTVKDVLNFTDNFHEVSHVIEDFVEQRPSNSSTPKSKRHNPADTLTDSPNINGSGMTSHILELSAEEITIHQSSEEEDSEDNRKASSLGDLSRLDGNTGKSNTTNRPSTGTLERAQSLEMAENTQIPTAPPKKRKAPVSDSDLCEKEPRLMTTDVDSMDTLQRGRLKSANEWGNLEDAISGKIPAADTNSDTDSSGRLDDATEQELESSVTSLVKEVMAVMDGGKSDFEKSMTQKETEVKESVEHSMKTMEQLLKEKLDEARVALETDDDEETNPSTGAFTTSTKLNGSLDRRETQEPPTLFVDEPAKINFTFKLEDNDLPNLASETPPESPGVNTNEQIKVISFGTNGTADDIKVTRFPFGSLERPKSDVLKKVIAQKMMPLEDYTTTTTTSTTTLISEPQPVSLTLIRGDDQIVDEAPVYSSDVKGVNSISISSMEVNIAPPPAPTMTVNGTGNTIVTISTNTDRSQPSSIILIEDEKLDFTLRTPPSELNDDIQVVTETKPPVPPLPAARTLTLSDDVFIVDSLSQPKRKVAENGNLMGENEDAPAEELSDQDVLDALKTFVTEIDVQNEAEKLANKLTLEATEKFLAHEKRFLPESLVQGDSPPPMAIPRNTEIKFTTSTYESSSPRINGNGERRHSAHVDQIRSTFERNSNSEIPVPVRKSSIPTLKLSPSKIPVFNSSPNTTKSSSVEGLPSSSSSSPPTQRYSLTSKSPSPTNNNRVSVTVTSIKNSARHPSGK